MNPVGPLSPSLVAQASTQQDATKAEQAKVASAAKQFEAALLRTMLSSMEKSMASKSSGASMYASMRVNALSDALADAGGIGLAKMLSHELAQEASVQKGSQGSPNSTVHRVEEPLIEVSASARSRSDR